MSLDTLFSPRAVAIVGASNRELTIGYRIIQNLLDFGFRGPIYPVNPKGGEIRGLPAYPSILETKNTHVPACLVLALTQRIPLTRSRYAPRSSMPIGEACRRLPPNGCIPG